MRCTAVQLVWYKQITTPHHTLLCSASHTLSSPPRQEQQRPPPLVGQGNISAACLSAWLLWSDYQDLVLSCEFSCLVVRCGTRRESGESRERRRRTG